MFPSMHILLTLVAFLVIFSLLILIHEAGHFFVAKQKGIKIEEFGFGLPPRIWGKKFGETLYSLNWIPFGGFVRMLGEDARDPKAAKSSRSFARKSKWARTQVVCAGVVMNFLLAWVLFSIGFAVGMQPLVVSGDDFLNGIRNGQIVVEPLSEAPLFGEADLGEADMADAPPPDGVQIFELPRVVMASSGLGFEPGDVVNRVNGEEVFFAEELAETVEAGEPFTVDFLRKGEGFSTIVSGVGERKMEAPSTVISKVMPESPAEVAGVAVRDFVVAVNGIDVATPEEVVEVVTGSESPEVTYTIVRNGVLMSFEMTKNEDGFVGVLLGELKSYDGLDFYDGSVRYALVEIANVSYPFYEAPWQALVEIKRIAGFTVVMIGRLFGNIFVSGEVPPEVAGPVGIAQMTGIYVQQGFVALMRFTGLLSLSLAVINIFPFPALDGGRQLFILIEALRGKPLDSRVEGYIHSVGFLFLILVILLVTFQDVGRLLSGG